MGLKRKILLFTGGLLVAYGATTLGWASWRADRLARASIAQGLSGTRTLWEELETERLRRLHLGLQMLAQDPGLGAGLEEGPGRAAALLRLRATQLGADMWAAFDARGGELARGGPTLPADHRALRLQAAARAGRASSDLWAEGDRIYHCAAAPLRVGGAIVGVVVAGWGLQEELARTLRNLTRSEIAYLTHPPGLPPQLSVTSLGLRWRRDLVAALGRRDFAEGGSGQAFELDLAGERYVGVQLPLRGAGGELVGSFLSLRSLSEETRAFREFRRGLFVTSAILLGVALAVANGAARRLTRPLSDLLSVAERARAGSFSGVVAAPGRDEVALLARTFNGLLCDLREQREMVALLRESAGGPSWPAKGLGEGATPPGASSSHPLVLAGRYQILERVGRGGMGVVYRALDRELDEIVALKVLREDALRDDPRLRELFKREIKLARRVSHRNVVRTYDFGEVEGVTYISMEYVEGVALKELLRSRGALPLGVGLAIGRQIALALEAAHLRGVVHRDIKPQNVLILPDGEVKVADFGIARALDAGEAGGGTPAGLVRGTPDYLPPEQAMGLPADPRSDLYALGVVLFEVFCGRLPFVGDTPVGTVLKHLNVPPPRPRDLDPTLPEALEALILKCLEKSPEARYASAHELVQDLATLSEGLQVRHALSA